MSVEPTLAPDAAIVLGFASTAMPFARTPAAEAERWLRILRIHGDVSLLLQALGVSDGSLEAAGEEPAAAPERSADGQPGRDDRDAVAQVAQEAALLASRRGSASVATTDVLMAVMQVYGEDFDRVLRAHGTDRAAVLELLDATAPA
jgi:ATP-dependent Clp protease ATP-binding subunit ClpA